MRTINNRFELDNKTGFYKTYTKGINAHFIHGIGRQTFDKHA